MGFSRVRLSSADEAQLQKIDELAVSSSPTASSLAALLNTANSNLGTTSDSPSYTGTANAKLAALLQDNADFYAAVYNACMNMAKNASNLTYAPSAATAYNLNPLTVANQISMNGYTTLQLPGMWEVTVIICETLSFGGGVINLGNTGDLTGASNGGSGAGGNPANSLIIVAKNIVVSSTSTGTINGNGTAGGAGAAPTANVNGYSGGGSLQGDNYTLSAGGSGSGSGGAGGGQTAWRLIYAWMTLQPVFRSSYNMRNYFCNGGGGSGGAVTTDGNAAGGGGGGTSICNAAGNGGNGAVANSANPGSGGGGGGAGGNVAILSPNPIPAGLTINLNGGAGGAGYDNGGGGGGGAGGCAVSICPSFGGTFNAAGGAGGAGSAAGNAGKNGYYWLIPWSL